METKERNSKMETQEITYMPFHEEWLEVMDTLLKTDKQKLQVYTAIQRFYFYGEEPEELDPLVALVVNYIRMNSLDHDRQRYRKESLDEVASRKAKEYHENK